MLRSLIQIKPDARYQDDQQHNAHDRRKLNIRY
jgi:hypothetical protein